MELYQLRYFRSIVDFGSMAAAANAMNVTQPALSYAVSQLEKELGVPLFMRRGGKLQPTSAGVILFDVACSALKQLDNSIDRIRSESLAEGKRIYIGVAYNCIISEAIYCYIKQNPQCHLYETLPFLDTALHSLEIGALDFLVTYEEIKNPKIKQLPLFQDQLIALVSKENPLAGKECLTIGDLTSNKIIYKGLPWTMMAFLSIGSKTLSPETYGIDMLYEGNDDITVQQLAEENLGILVMPRSEYDYRYRNAGHRKSNQLNMVPLDPAQSSRTIFLSYQQESFKQKNMQSFLDYMIAFYDSKSR